MVYGIIGGVSAILILEVLRLVNQENKWNVAISHRVSEFSFRE
ncbi:hypothetical protein [Streptococcus sobrinus]|nr:hypothetical protein [Streptococcus sobrinus]